MMMSVDPPPAYEEDGVGHAAVHVELPPPYEDERMQPQPLVQRLASLNLSDGAHVSCGDGVSAADLTLFRCK